MNLKKQSKKEKDFLKLLGQSGTKDILFYLNRHGKGQYKDFNSQICSPVLNKRLPRLVKFGLITHHLTREDMKKEWYEITDTGKKVVEHLRRLIEISAFEEEGGEDEQNRR
ncbi:MAG: hypothetical protein AYK18_17360 [Theionarchaea archaeon DG-70]|nr:MAG: hypothetical protein AYK18_17360 [Theionarchaea archaeon DG-70]